MSSGNSEKKNNEKAKEKVGDERIKQIKENLTCSILKKNYIDDPTILLGYPIIQTKSAFNHIELYPIPEMLSYEGFLTQINAQVDKLDFYFETNFRTSRNQLYNCWMPVYINKEHYEKNKTHVLNSFSIIKYGPEGKKEYDFKAEQIFEILPIILNKMIIGMFNGKVEISSAFITSYFQFVLLYKKLCLEFEEENLVYLNKTLSLILDNEYKIDKKILPDIGNFFMILFFCNKDTHEEGMKKMWDCLFEEFVIRQMFWLFHGDENREKMKRLVLKTKNNEVCLNRYENDKNFKMRNLDKFNEDLNKLKLFDQIVDIISKDKKYLESLLVGKDKARENVAANMNKNFKSMYIECGEESKKQINQIITNNLDFSDYFGELHDDLYDNFKVSEILKDENIKNKEEIVKYAFESQRGNSLLIITFFAQKKIEEKGFMEELEKNYGIYLDVDNFITDMNKKLEEIKSYKDLYAFIGSDLGKDKTDMQLIIEAYDKAKEKGYIKPQRFGDRSFRGRGRGRGFGGRGFRGRGFRGRGRGNGFRERGRGGYRGFGGRGRGFGGRFRRFRGRGRGGFRGRRFNMGRDRDNEGDSSRERNGDSERPRSPP